MAAMKGTYFKILIFKLMVENLFESVKNGFEMVIYLAGHCLWMGIMNIGEEAGIMSSLSRLVSPLFSRLFPEIPKRTPSIWCYYA